MDRENLLRALNATTQADDTKEASQFLDKCAKLPGFTPELLKIACDQTIGVPVRQAAVIYFKNTVSKFWELDKDEDEEPHPDDFTISAEDKETLKSNILEAICISGDNTRPQLCVAAQQMIRTDFPEKWPALLPGIEQKLMTPDGSALQGALLLIYRMSKVYEYKRAKDRKPMVDVMKVLLPLLQHHFSQLAPNDSQESVTIQKLLFKIFFALIQFNLNFEMVTLESIDAWLEFSKQVLLRGIPEEIANIEDPEERGLTVWWKCKKWAAKILERIFERYSAPGQTEHGYAEFGNHFVQNFSIPCSEVMMKLLSDKRSGVFVTDRVTLLALSFLNTSVSHSHTWKVIKPHAQEIITTVLFPLLCHSDEDEEMWEDDVEEYIRFKYDIFEDIHNPSYGAGTLLASMSRRKDIIQPVLAFTIGILSSSQEPRQIEGALRMIGELAEQLCKSKKYKKDVEKLLDAHVINRLGDGSRFVRSRAAWCLKQYSGAYYSGNKILKKAIQGLVHVLCNTSEELPAKVEAAIAIESFLDDQEEKAHDLVKPHVQDIIPKVLDLSAHTQIEDTVSVMDKLMDEFIEDVVPIAVKIADQLCTLFLDIIKSDVAEERTPALMSIINTLSNVLDVVSDHREIMVQIEQIVLKIIVYVFETANIDYYDEILLLIQSLIAVYVSEPMWTVFDMVYQLFKGDKGIIIQFSDLVPVLHLYIVTDTESFLARPDRLNAIIDMCKQVLENSEEGDENQLYAAKLLEVVILQCSSMIQEAYPAVIVIALERLTKPFDDGLSELRHMLILVVVAALYTNAELAFKVLKELAPDHPNPLDFLTAQLLELSDKFEGIHNRKMAIFAWCTLMQLPKEVRPSIFTYEPKRVLQSCVKLFNGLQRALKTQADNRKADMDSDSDEDDDDDGHRKIDDDLSDDDDEIDECTLEYLDNLAKENRGDLDTDDSDDDYEGDEEETETEQYQCILDEENAPDVFVNFKSSMESFKQTEEVLFQQMISTLEELEKQQLVELDKTCDNHVKAEQSKKVLEQGGYSFNAEAVVPGNFNFGSS